VPIQPMFDPETGRVLDRDALRSLRFGMPRKPRVVVDREKDVKHVELIGDTEFSKPQAGKSAGYETHHADGTWDCTMTPEPVTLSLGNKES
jgi:hypothetical protein